MSIPAPLAAELQELEYRRDAAPIFKVLSKLRSPFWLDSSRSVATGVGGRYDIMSAEPSALLQTIGDITRITSSSGSVIETSNDDPYRLLQQQLDKLQRARGRTVARCTNPNTGAPMANAEHD